jgi:hypothetical protein
MVKLLWLITKLFFYIEIGGKNPTGTTRSCKERLDNNGVPQGGGYGELLDEEHICDNGVGADLVEQGGADDALCR